jgi:NADH-quinone oxidoreductase subunit M
MGLLALLCLGNILYVGLVAMRQKDFSLLIGNSSVAHMGFAFLGIASLTLIGITGTVLVMIAHGFLAALTFAICGYLYQQTNTTDMTALSGLFRKLPFIGTALVMAAFAGCGLPGFANFVGEVMVFFGSWSERTAVTVAGVWGALIIGAIYMLRAVRNILHGVERSQWTGVKDATDPWRRLPFVLLLASLLLFGVAPRLLTDRIRPSAEKVVKMIAPASEPGSQRVKTAANLVAPLPNN